MSDVHCFVNPAAARGRTRARAGEIGAALEDCGATVVLHCPDSEAEFTEDIDKLVAVGVERLVVAGGDGTVQIAANALARSATTLGIIPAGTGNDTATSLGISSQLEVAAAQALGDASPVDLIWSPAGYSLQSVTFGFAVAASDRADRISRPKGGMRYTLASILELPRVESYLLDLVIDGRAETVEAIMVVLANTDRFGSGIEIAPGADPTDGQLELVIVESAGLIELAGVLALGLSGAHTRSRRVRLVKVTDVTISAARSSGGTDLASLELRAGGEQFDELPIRLSVAHGGLLVAGVTS